MSVQVIIYSAITCALLLYAGSFWLALAPLRATDAAKHTAVVSQRWLWGLCAASAHVLAALPSGLSFFASLAWVAALMALLSHVMLTRKGEHFLPAIADLLAILSLIALTLAPRPRALEGLTSAPDWPIQLHAAIALLSYAILSLAALQALLMLHSEAALRQRRHLPSWLPPVSRLERHLFALIGAGFAGLTLTLLSGAVFINNWFAQHLVHKTVLTGAAWLCFLALLVTRWRWGLRGRSAAIWTLSGMVLLLLAFFGSKLVLELILKRS